jgi:predicted permease
MTTILVIIIIYLAIAHIFNFVAVACGCLLTDFEDLISNLLWIIMVPAVIVNKIVKNYKRKKTQK